MNRRDFLKLVMGVPVLGGALILAAPFIRYLRPSTDPISHTHIETDPKNKMDITKWQGDDGLVKRPDMPKPSKEISFAVSEFTGPWSYQTFVFGQLSKEYTFKHFQTSNIPGFVVRLPEPQENGQPDFIIVSRICPHMGCVFNFEQTQEAIAAYNYPIAKNPHFCCPCHLSVFDPMQKQDAGGALIRGKVVSGPAPRPPRQFTWEIAGDTLVIKEAEAGGIS